MPTPMKTPARETARSRAPRVAPRRRSADMRLAIMEALTSGLSVAHIAKSTHLTARRVRQIVADMLEKREFDPAGGFAQLQIARLNDAMSVAHTMMMEGDLAALDRVIKLAGELDRYHGYAPGPLPALAPPQPPRGLAAPKPRLLAPATANAERQEEIFPPAND